MNRKQNLLLLLALPLFITFSCNPDDDAPPSNSGNTPPAAGQISATLGQSEFETNEATARYRSSEELTITGIATDGKKFFFVIDGFSGNLDYSFGPGLANSATYEQLFNNTTTTFSTTTGGTGTLSVTEYNEENQFVSGTFSFTAAQVNNVGNTINVTDGTFENVPIRTLGTAEEGKAIYYADDVYYDSRMPVMNQTVLRMVNLDIEIGGGNTYNVRFPDLLTEAGAVDGYLVHENSDFDNSINPGSFTILEYNEAENWVSAIFRLQHRDFEMSLTKYPLEVAPPPGDGHLIMYTDTGSFVSELISFDMGVWLGSFFVDAFLSPNFDFWYSPGYAQLLDFGTSLYIPGQAVIEFDEANSIITYWAFESDDETIRFAGENIPY